MRRLLLPLAGVAVIALVGGGALLLQIHAAPAAATTAIPMGTATVVRTDIVNHQRIAGTLGYGPTRAILAPAGDGGEHLAGTLTSVPEPGVTISQGQVLYGVSDHPVVLLYGDHPDWRRLAVGVTGTDVKQLEEDLVTLGFATSVNLHNDGVFTSADAAAVIRFQAANGVPQTGALAAGEVIFEPGPVRVTAVPVSRGGMLQPGAPVLTVTSVTHVVTVALEPARQSVVKPGDPVTILMPDGTTNINGHVAAISRVAQQAAAGNPNGQFPTATVNATVTLDDDAKAGTLDLAPVFVSIATATHKAVLAVPVTALLAQPDGSYAVSVVSGGQRHAVAVKPGLFGDGGQVEVSSTALSAGDSVAVPAR